MLDLAYASYLAAEIEEAVEFAKYSYFNHFEARGMEAKLTRVDAVMTAKITTEYDRLIVLLTAGKQPQEIKDSFSYLADLLTKAAGRLN